MSENKEYYITATEGGAMHISQEVIGSIAAIAATEVEGVVGLNANLGDEIAVFLGKKTLSRGIKLTINEDNVAIDVYLNAQYGYSVVEIARNVQEKVKTAVESMVGCQVRSVNVDICAITFPKSK